MNKTRIKELRDHIAGLPKYEFDHNDPNNCVLGHAFRLFGGTTRLDMARLLGMRESNVRHIYDGTNTGADEADFNFDRTQDEAVGMLDRLMETGCVNWDGPGHKASALERLLTAVAASITAWRDEEDSVQEEHEDTIKELEEAFDAYR